MRPARRPLMGIALALVFAFLLAAPFGFKPYGIFILSMWAVMTIAAIGLNLTLGYAGQVSLAQGAFVGIGAYTAAILTTSAGWPLLATLPVAIVLCFAIGWLLGYPALRVQHHYLAFVTLALSTLVFLVFRNEEWLTKGIYGLMMNRPAWFASPLSFYYLCLGSLSVVSLATWCLIRSPLGRGVRGLCGPLPCSNSFQRSAPDLLDGRCSRPHGPVLCGHRTRPDLLRDRVSPHRVRKMPRRE